MVLDSEPVTLQSTSDIVGAVMASVESGGLALKGFGAPCKGLGVDIRQVWSGSLWAPAPLRGLGVDIRQA